MLVWWHLYTHPMPLLFLLVATHPSSQVSTRAPVSYLASILPSQLRCMTPTSLSNMACTSESVSFSSTSSGVGSFVTSSASPSSTMLAVVSWVPPMNLRHFLLPQKHRIGLSPYRSKL